MFNNTYQGGAVVEVFSGQGKDPVAKWKLYAGPSAIHKEYNKEVKGFVYCLEGSSQRVKMQMPQNGKMSLGLLQRFLVLQVNIPQCKDFSIELVVTDSERRKRRLHLSTVHKELSATLLHAKIPFVGLKRSIWSTLCIDLASFTGELFKGFLTLDGITLFATCKVRRIFTMKTEPTGMSNDDMFLSGSGIMDLIPRSCHFPPDVNNVTQVLNIDHLRKADMRPGLLSSDCVPDHSTAAVSTSYRRSRHQGVLHKASGSTLSGPPPQTGRKSSAASDGMDKNGSPRRMHKKVPAESESIAKLSENVSHREASSIPIEGMNARALGTIQPHPPKDTVFDKQRLKKLRVYSAGRERLVSSATDAVPGGQRKRSKTREKYTAPPSCQQSKQPLTQTEKRNHLTADVDSCSPARESSRDAPIPAESLSCSIRPGFSSDLQVWNSWESNEGPEPQLTLRGEVFTFSSQPHSPKRGQDQGNQEETEMGHDHVRNKNVRQFEAQLEGDFIGSESDEDKSYNPFNLVTARSPSPTLDVQCEVHPESQNIDQITPKELKPATTGRLSPSSARAEPAGIAPTRYFSPSATPSRQELKCSSRGSEVVNQVVDENSSVSLSRRLQQEVKLDDSTQHKVIVLKAEDNNTLKPVDSSDYNLHVLSSSWMPKDDDHELRMLAGLKKDQGEYECKASGLSASQIHHCNVSMSSDDASTWTHISTPDNQGPRYQKEMNPLLQSNPREWMDVLSPPTMPPSHWRRSGNTQNNLEDIIGGRDQSVHEEEKEDEYLNLLYDPCLNCYFDPKTGKYYELA
ncbi:protein CFAP20DC isoform X2 [Clinocottus analis]|uniref:protein CFAP20DC isoform X2 n=1 Tax=Clinocottus analis TaxID=304258 RepID=UPI0035BF0304